MIAINLTSAFHTTRLAVPAMREANWGRIINIASAHGLVASAQKSAYVAAKHGIVGLTKAVALETATTGITSNAICPGWVLTPLVQKQIDDRSAREGISIDAGPERSAGREAAFAAVHHGGTAGRARRVPVLAGRRPGARRRLAGRRRLDRAVALQPYFSCTEPDTLTTTLVLPASTGTAASKLIFADGLHRHHARPDRRRPGWH